MTSPVSAGLALTLEHRICKPLSLPNLLTWRGEGRRRGRGEVKLKRHAWAASVPQWAARGENRAPRSCSVQVNKVYEKKSPTAKMWLPNPKMFWYVIFYSADITGIEYLGLSQQMWSHTQESTDLSLCLFFSGLFTSFFPEETRTQTEATTHTLTAAGATKRIQGTSKGTGRVAKQNNMSHIILYCIYILEYFWYWCESATNLMNNSQHIYIRYANLKQKHYTSYKLKW